MNYTADNLKRQFQKLAFQWPDFHFVGIRSNADAPDAFDDVFYLIDRGVIIGKYSGTTNPGAYWLQNFFSPVFGGTAVLASNQQLLEGFERGQIYGREGWRQRKPSKIFRDSNKDLKSDETGIPQIGMWSIHIHAMFKAGKSVKIWNWSEGCQGLNVESEWNDFMAKTANVKYLNYTLLKEF